MRTVNVIEGIFFAALEKQTPVERKAYLDEACTGDAELRRCVERMLDAQPKIGGFLQPSAPAPSAAMDEPPLVEKPGTVIGPYKLLQELGEGGFGVVFMAEQQQPVRRKVALKIIKPGMDSKQVVARFEAERQALALMDHPNIARVLDGGLTSKSEPRPLGSGNDAEPLPGGRGSEGRPYFVMELVKGIPITEFCDKNRLTPHERLELFIPVCQAVQHAHHKGIIHRDIKPSNVLVTMYDDKTVPKVIDFGVAKAIEQKLTEQTLFTRVGQIIGTLEYMSPEQASLNALDVDTRADVYALGVLLYELLTGTTPLNKQRLEGVAFLEMLRLIREEEPPKPSTRLSESGDALTAFAVDRRSDSQKLPKLVRGELDWIAMRALDKDRARRYATANALAADVQRYLKDEQVEACPPSVGYRLRKYARKHKTEFAMASIAAALLLFGMAATSWQAVRATRAEGDAVVERTKAQEERDNAIEARQAEADQRNLAVAAQHKAQEERDKVRRLHYTAALNLIPTAWEADNVGRILELLDEQRPGANEIDLRGFEWHYWDRMCHAEVRTLKLDEDSGTRTGVFSGDGTRVAYVWNRKVGTTEASIKVRDIGTGREVRSWNIKNGNVALQLNRDGTRLLTANGLPPNSASRLPNRVVVWDVADGKELFVKELSSAAFSFGLGRQITLSPDGKLLATFDRGVFGKDERPRNEPPAKVIPPGLKATRLTESVRIWNVDDPSREPATVESVTGLFDLKFSPDGSRLAGVTSSRTGDLAGPGVIGLLGASGRFTGFAGSTIHVQLWDTATGKLRADDTLNHPMPTGPNLAFSPDGTRLAALRCGPNFAASQETYLWDCASGNQLKLLRSTPVAEAKPTAIEPHEVAFSPNGRHLLIWSYYAPLALILDARTGALHQTLKPRMAIASAAFSADGGRVLTAGCQNLADLEVGSKSSVQEWAVHPSERPTPEHAPPLDPKPIEEIAVWSPDGSRQAVKSTGFTGKDDLSEIRIRDRDGKQIRVFSEHAAPIATIVFSPDSRLVYSQAASGDVKIWETDTGKVRWEANDPTSGFPMFGSTPIAFSPDGHLVTVPTPEGVKMVSTADFREKSTVEGTSAALFPWPDCFFSPDGRRLVVFNSAPFPKAGIQPEPAGQHELKLWDVEAGREIESATFKHHESIGFRNHRIAFSPDSRFLAVHLAGHGEVTILDAATGKQRSILQVAATRSLVLLQSILFSPDGTRVVLQTGGGPPGAAPSGMSVWDTATGKLLFRLEGTGPFPTLVAFSPDGKRIATSDLFPPATKLWDAATGRELLSLKHAMLRPPLAARLSFSPDGHRLTLQTPDGQGPSWDATPRTEAAKEPGAASYSAPPLFAKTNFARACVFRRFQGPSPSSAPMKLSARKNATASNRKGTKSFAAAAPAVSSSAKPA
jgi:serine/threonine protein kinase/WD40 repeat protein